ncbi:MAG: hypothetical protein D8M57_03955 [Candidatus Scalindua sp. AMX11]|nr:MAG: hypothetical protein DWQ00_10740 [Candidatus Scalindua sp.]NOG82681.1 hypothetical protein [Planctomycetota bacterium]RZV95255.1 MAG: hypothetical protein EX341_02680 [Candidatus Scalindua sp. SCAELEC01]TDE66265.1 MAG: hypothetical protein D8M57_03955 [Candidatus Scalindua sp. AMX11]
MSYTKLVIDGHVHYYNCYDPERFFDAAITNLEISFRSNNSKEGNLQKILLFTEGKEHNNFSRFKNNGIRGHNFGFENTKEGCSLILTKNSEPHCFILAGRQIVTQEKLEILSLASTHKIEDGLPAKEVVTTLLDRKEITVLPWGVGKWFFKRGKTIKKIVKEYHSPYLFIGDNGARPSFWPTPKLYDISKEFGVRVVSGSDPLPFSEDTCRVGTFGFTIEGRVSVDKPAESFRNILLSNKGSITLFGNRDNARQFLRRQLKHRLNKFKLLQNLKP